MAKQYRSELLASVHETAEGLHQAGLMPKRTLREFDALCLTPVRSFPPKKIRQLRLREGASQAVFARYLNVSTGLMRFNSFNDAPCGRFSPRSHWLTSPVDTFR